MKPPAFLSTRPNLAAAVLGGVAGLALPPVHLVPVLWGVVPALVWLLARQGGVWGAVRVGFWFGFGHHVVGLYWITEAILIEAARYWWLVPLAVPALAAVLAVFVAAACGAARAFAPGWPRVVGLAGAWGVAELARQFVLTGFPWNPWGSVWALPGGVGDAMLQPAAWVGVHGLTMATVLLAGLPALGWRPAAAGLLALALWAGAGAWRLGGAAGPAPGLSVVLVQGNIDQGQKWDNALMAAIFDRYLGLTQAAVAGLAGPAAVVWPETASPYLLDRDAMARTMIATAAGGRTVLAGAVRFDAERRPYNSLMALTGPGAPVAVYDKWHLVPFGEYQPSWLPLALSFGPGGFQPGPGPRTLLVPGLPPVGALICYEVIFPGEGVSPLRPDWLVTVTNDAWFGNSSGPRQHLAAARLRAVEEGLPIMRAANTGISAGYDAFGRELGRLGMGETGTLTLALPGKLPPTLFGQLGLWLPAGFALLLLGVAWRGRNLS